MPIWAWGRNWFAPRVRAANWAIRAAFAVLGLIAAFVYVFWGPLVFDAAYWVLGKIAPIRTNRPLRVGLSVPLLGVYLAAVVFANAFGNSPPSGVTWSKTAYDPSTHTCQFVSPIATATTTDLLYQIAVFKDTLKVGDSYSLTVTKDGQLTESVNDTANTESHCFVQTPPFSARAPGTYKFTFTHAGKTEAEGTLTITGAVPVVTASATGGPSSPATRPDLEFSPATLPDAQVGSPYAATITVSQAATPVFSAGVAAGALPAGLVLALAKTPDNTIRISGTPTVSGTLTFTIDVLCYGTTVNGQSAAHQYELVVK
jgi:hypothetical protein